jgi:hypothetical protein
LIHENQLKHVKNLGEKKLPKTLKKST